jgi:hypothetical protein
VNFKTTIVRAPADDVLAADELFTFVQMKVQQLRLWLVICNSACGWLSVAAPGKS